MLLNKNQKNVPLSRKFLTNNQWTSFGVVVIVEIRNLLNKSGYELVNYTLGNWVEVSDDDLRWAHSTKSQIKFQTAMWKPNLCYCCVLYIVNSNSNWGRIWFSGRRAAQQNK